MTHTPKVTVVITTYNRANLLPRAVESVLAQTYTDYEIIIVDDCSSDDTQDVVAGFDDWRIHSFRHECNKGPSAARNTGIFNANGKYIAFLDDDDEWLPVNLEAQVHFMDKASCKVGLVYGWRDVVDDSSGSVIPGPRHTHEGDLFEYLLAINHPAGGVGFMVRKSVALEISGFKEDLDIGEDAIFLARIAQRCRIAVVPQVTFRFHTTHGHRRLTDQLELGRAKYIKAHMHTFADELDKRPKTRALVLRKLALTEMRCGNWRASLSAAAASLRLDPLGTIDQGVRYFVRSCYRHLRAPGGLERS